MNKVISLKIANAFGAQTYEAASMTNADGTEIGFIIIVPPDANLCDAEVLANVLPQSAGDVSIPEMVCLARSLSNWRLPFIPEDERFSDTSNFAPEQYKPRELVELKPGNQSYGSLVLLAGEELYADIAKYMNFLGPVYAVDNSFSFVKIVNSYKADCLAQHFSMDLISEEYALCIKAAGIEGDLYLGGFSLGGNIAIEVAKKLRSHNRKVPSVFLFDAFTPESVRNIPKFRWLFRHFQKLRRMGSVHLKEVVGNVKQRLEQKFSKQNGMDKRPSTYGTHRDRDLVRLFHNTECYTGSVKLFRSNSSEPYIPPEIDYGWKKFVSDLEIIHLPGDHSSFIHVNAKKIAETLTAIIGSRIDDCNK